MPNDGAASFGGLLPERYVPECPAVSFVDQNTNGHFLLIAARCFSLAMKLCT